MTDVEIKLPDEILENIPEAKNELVQYLSSYFDGVIDKYDSRFQKRVMGILGQPLSRYEKAMLKDFLMDLAIGKLEEESILTK